MSYIAHLRKRRGMMKGLLKWISIFIVCFMAMDIVESIEFSAKDSPENKGKMYFEAVQNREVVVNIQSQHVETDMDNIYPELLQEETKEIITRKQDEQKKSSITLKESIFKVTEEDATNATLDDVKETLFTSDYTPPKSSEVNEANEEDPHTESVSKGLLSTIAGLVLLLCGGVYAIFNKMTS